jgi:hypothetical protein
MKRNVVRHQTSTGGTLSTGDNFEQCRCFYARFVQSSDARCPGSQRFDGWIPTSKLFLLQTVEAEARGCMPHARGIVLLSNAVSFMATKRSGFDFRTDSLIWNENFKKRSARAHTALLKERRRPFVVDDPSANVARRTRCLQRGRSRA